MHVVALFLQPGQHGCHVGPRELAVRRERQAHRFIQRAGELTQGLRQLSDLGVLRNENIKFVMTTAA